MKTTSRIFATATLAVLYGASALAQQNTPSSSSVPKAVRGAHFRSTSSDPGAEGPGGPGFGPHSGPNFGPPGMWWKNPDIAQKLNLSDDQKKKMDDIFQQSRLQLIDLKANVERQEALLEPMLAANPPDTNKVLAQIDQVASARAELEKAVGRMLLNIRSVLTADQWTKLQAERSNFRRKFDGRGSDGPGGFGPGGPRSNGFKGPGGGPGAPISMDQSRVQPPTLLAVYDADDSDSIDFDL